MKILQINICKLRKNFGMTQRELSEKLGVTFQTVSKWENGNSYPDITLLPLLASTFKISVDQLLGVIPLETGVYNRRKKNTAEYRDKILGQFKASRALFWNDDYLNFMIRDIWKIHTPVHVAEIACGNGVFATQLMPLLPKGSTYTGYELSQIMRGDGNILLTDYENIKILPFSEIDDGKETFDIVFCQGYLRHLNNPLTGITQLMSLAKKDGLIIGHEENRPFEISGLLLGDLKDTSFESGVFLDKLWHHELNHEGRDYRIGLRLPLLLQKAGLTEIQCRMNDHVDILLGDESSENQLKLLNDHYAVTSINEDYLLNFVMERGLTQYEAQRYVELFKKRKSYMDQPYKDVNLVHVMGLMISWGRK